MWACRNGVLVNSTHLQQLLQKPTTLVYSPIHRAQLLAVLRDVHKHALPVQADDSAGGGTSTDQADKSAGGERTQKRRKSKR